MKGLYLSLVALAGLVAAASSASAQSVSVPDATQSAPYYSCSRNWYVDAVNGNDSNAGTSATTAFQTINKATSGSTVLKPGDCVNVAPGTYNQFVLLSGGGNSNTLTGYVAIISTQKWGARIVGPATGGYSTVITAANYLAIDGFDVSGGDGGHCIDAGYNNANNHHLIIINNHVHNCAGSGISTVGGDYLTIEGNVSEHNAGTSLYQTSGISIAASKAATGFTATPADSVTYHIVIRNNVSHNNIETFPCSELSAADGCHTDGEGIIIDTNDANGYTAAVLVQGNLVYENGGEGIQVGRSHNATVAGNVSYDNYLDTDNSATWRPELGNVASSNCTWVNNIATSFSGTGILANNVALLDSGQMTIAGVAYADSGTVWSGNVAVGGITFFSPASISTGSNPSSVNPL
jgi:hypothetical protein